MSEPDQTNVRLITRAVGEGLRKLNPAHAPRPDEDAADLDENGWRKILERFEKQFRAAQQEEQER